MLQFHEKIIFFIGNGEKNNVDQLPVPSEDTEELIESSQSQELDSSSKRRSRRSVSNSSKNNITTSKLDDQVIKILIKNFVKLQHHGIDFLKKIF